MLTGMGECGSYWKASRTQWPGPRVVPTWPPHAHTATNPSATTVVLYMLRPHCPFPPSSNTQVFPSPAFDDLLAALRARHSAGGPAVHVASYTLDASTTRPCRRVRVVWVVNADHGSWEGRLPWHVRFELHTDRRLAEAGMLGASTASLDDQQQGQQQGQCDSLHDFPYCASLASTHGTAAAASPCPSPTPSPQLVSLLAHHAAGMVEGAREQLREAVGLGAL